MLVNLEQQKISACIYSCTSSVVLAKRIEKKVFLKKTRHSAMKRREKVCLGLIGMLKLKETSQAAFKIKA